MKLDLNDRDRICFFGDSITHNGWWISEIYQYFTDNYPELNTMFFNCGVAGTQAKNANQKDRMYCDLFNFFPKYVVVMFGMNDVDTHLYDPLCTEDNKEKERKQRIAEYRNSLDNIINLCKKENAIPIICTPTPYDEYNLFESPNFYADKALAQCSEIAKQAANDNNLIFVDMRSIFLEHINDKPIGNDRVHPNKFGHHLMAEKFLVSIGAKKQIEVNSKCDLSKINVERFKIEQILRNLFFVEMNYMGWQNKKTMPLCDRKAEVSDRIKELINPKDEWIKNTFNEYLEYADYKNELTGKLILLSSSIYNCK